MYGSILTLLIIPIFICLHFTVFRFRHKVVFFFVYFKFISNHFHFTCCFICWITFGSIGLLLLHYFVFARLFFEVFSRMHSNLFVYRPTYLLVHTLTL